MIDKFSNIKINKKMLISLGFACGLLLIGKIAHAEELGEAIEAYVNNHSVDFLGRDYDKILFESLKNGDGNFFINELKFTLQDIKTLPQQAKAYFKILHQPPNMVAYSTMGGLYSIKSAVGAAEFNKIMLKILKSTKQLKGSGAAKSFLRLLKF